MLDRADSHAVRASASVEHPVRSVLSFLGCLGLARAEDHRVRVAVSYFENTAAEPVVEPLRKGFAEMLATDLATSPQLAVVERARLDAVLQELKLGTSAFMNKVTGRRPADPLDSLATDFHGAGDDTRGGGSVSDARHSSSQERTQAPVPSTPQAPPSSRIDTRQVTRPPPHNEKRRPHPSIGPSNATGMPGSTRSPFRSVQAGGPASAGSS
jgi:hypothetical protein